MVALTADEEAIRRGPSADEVKNLAIMAAACGKFVLSLAEIWVDSVHSG
jgi:hypothetical protein